MAMYHGFIYEMLPQYGVEVTMVDTSDLNNIEKAMKQNTKVVYVETPANPTMKMVDLKVHQT